MGTTRDIRVHRKGFRNVTNGILQQLRGQRIGRRRTQLRRCQPRSPHGGLPGPNCAVRLRPQPPSPQPSTQTRHPALRPHLPDMVEPGLNCRPAGGIHQASPLPPPSHQAPLAKQPQVKGKGVWRQAYDSPQVPRPPRTTAHSRQDTPAMVVRHGLEYVVEIHRLSPVKLNISTTVDILNVMGRWARCQVPRLRSAGNAQNGRSGRPGPSVATVNPPCRVAMPCAPPGGLYRGLSAGGYARSSSAARL